MTIRRFKFGEMAEERLQSIMDKLGTNDAANVIRKALRLFEWAVEEVETGKRVCAIDENGKGTCIDVHARDAKTD
jgi:hypothetical protein